MSIPFIDYTAVRGKLRARIAMLTPSAQEIERLRLEVALLEHDFDAAAKAHAMCAAENERLREGEPDA